MRIPSIGFRKVSMQAIQTLVRYPLPIVCAITAFALLSIRNHFYSNPGTLYYASNLTRLALTAIAGIPLFFVVHLYSTSHNLDKAKQLGLVLLGLCLLGLHFYSIPADYYNFELNYTLRYLNLLVCLHLLVSITLYHTEKDIYNFWQYNKYLLVQLLIALAFVATLIVGVCGALYATEKLFDVTIRTTTYYDVLLFCGIVMLSFLFFYNMPESNQQWQQKITYSTALRIFVQFICLPLIALYGLILGVYLIKVLSQSKLPESAIAMPILVFCAIALFTYLLAYPIMQGAYFWINFFCKYIFFVLLPYAVFLVLAVVNRCAKFGITENRYIAILLGLWIIGISVYMILSSVKNITLLPFSLGILLAIASFGKIGMFSVSAWSQTSRLINTLKQNGLIQNGRIKYDVAAAAKLSEADRNTILSSANYLFTHGEFERLKPYLTKKDEAFINKLNKEGYDPNNFGKVFGLDNFQTVQQAVETNPENISFNCANPELMSMPIDVSGGKHLAQFEATDYALNQTESPILAVEIVNGVLASNKLSIVQNGDTLVSTNVQPVVEHYQQLLQAELNDSSFFAQIGRIALPFSTKTYSRKEMSVSLSNCTLHLNNLTLQRSQNQLYVLYAAGYIVY